MPPLDPPARIPQLSPDDFNDETKAFFERWTVGPFKNADKNPPLLTYAHHPKLADLFSQLNIHLLLTNTVPVKQRQIAIMRTAWLCKSVYMWSSHLNTSLSFGLDPEMFKPIQAGAEDQYFTPFERVIVLATDELVADRKISNGNWDTLAKEWSHQQLLDFMFTVGTYVLTAGVMRSTGIQREPDLIALAGIYGAPEP
jgi:4-carboxymuconolactone decarboxylase